MKLLVFSPFLNKEEREKNVVALKSIFVFCFFLKSRYQKQLEMSRFASEMG